jgi:site-specific DNA-cytosine methylase
MTTTIELRHFHLFVGLGGGARGFNRASPRVGNLQGKFRCIGGVDVDPAAARTWNCTWPTAWK